MTTRTHQGQFAATGALRIAAGVVLLGLLAACGSKNEASSGQALASVDGKEITVHQLNAELGRGGAREASKQVLDGLVARQLLINAARKEKLDANPAVLANMERAKDLVLAQSYVQMKLGKPARPTPQEIDDFYAKHPQWFAQRRQFEFSELVIGAANLSDELNALMVGTRPLDEIASWLNAKRIPFTRLQVTKTSMDLPPAMLDELKTMERGHLFIVREGESAILASLADVRSAPLSQVAAAPQIEGYLMAQKQGQITDQALNQLRAEAKIDYFDKAKSLKDQAPAQAAAEPAAPAQGDAVSRGLSGIK
ncbi:EpsD family peptidyl-prolyl cis-trans isomerase [Herbaspirillum sp. WKF16]|uniref:EpsD family peptidyl-prolyl cis-trans isomerase n=1 Tax=Herbaspirillum sp. WKF16 TaxID=3028312 RepID=UPI0023A98014|nr:EpsD family peptidyl-prolyl cis-trans isomerase [Herbaspirillum sp. WKF16]WDZ97906.1 EpsD family peptidyl-prolyl cis-trans isomerase [Herbaspirillum sp. WKF16]